MTDRTFPDAIKKKIFPAPTIIAFYTALQQGSGATR